MPFRILSWNVETFGETKLKGIDNFVARVIARSRADLVFVLESTMHAQSGLATSISSELEAITGPSWFAFGSDPTGKSLPLPPNINGLPKVCDLKAYRPELLYCYNEPHPGQFVLKPASQINPGQEGFTREALERAGVLRRDLETYTGFFRYDPALYQAHNAYVALGSWVALSRVQPGDLVSANAQGVDIGYSDPTSGFNGRRPYRANLYFGAPANPATVEKSFPVIAFHAPFSDDMKVRMRANVGMLELATLVPGGPPIALRQQGAAVVCGDLNVNYKWDEDFTGLTLPVPTTKSLNAQNYGSFFAAGFALTIRELSSLKSVKPNLEPVTDPMEFRASAYDNVMVRCPTGNPISAATGGVIDLISDVFTASQAPGNYLTGTPGMPTAPRLFDAFRYVRTTVSDHLPAFCELQVPARP